MRLRILIDVLESLDRRCPIVVRSAESRLHIHEVRVRNDGATHLGGQGDETGVAELAWEILTGRERTAGAPRVHDIVDEVHPDVDDLVERALCGEVEDVGELLDELVRAVGDQIGSAEDVALALVSGGPRYDSVIAVVPSVLVIGLEDHDRIAVEQALAAIGVRTHAASMDDWRRVRRPKRLGCIVTSFGPSLLDLVLGLRAGPLHATPILVLTPGEHADEVIAMGADVCVALPAPADVLVAEVEALLGLV